MIFSKYLRCICFCCNFNLAWIFLRLATTLLIGMHASPSISAGAPEKVFVIGSSTAAGIGASRLELSWVGLLKPWALTNHNWIIENLSVSGLLTNAVACTSFKSLAQKAMTDGATYLILSFPSNDATANIESDLTIRNLQSVRQCASFKGVKVAVMSTLPRAGLSREQRAAINRVDRAMHRELGGCFIDVRAALSEGESWEPRMNFSAGDGVHFNDRGHFVIFNLVKKFIDKKQCI